MRACLLVGIGALLAGGCWESEPPDMVGDASPGEDGGAPRDGGASSPGAEVVAAMNARALDANDDRLFWAEYGTFDELDNYNNDGVIKARDLDGGPVETLAEGLPGPVGVHVTTDAVYVYVDRHIVAGGRTAVALMRLPLSGGELGLVTPASECGDHGLRGFAAAGTRAFWYCDPEIAMAADHGSPSERVLPEVALSPQGIQAYRSHLYFAEGGALHRVAFDGTGRTTLIDDIAGRGMLLQDGWVYSTERDQGAGDEGPTIYLGRSPVDGGAWKRLARVRYRARGHIEIVDGRYFLGEDMVYTGTLDGEEDVRELVPETSAWVATRVGVFFLAEGAIRKVEW